MLIERATARRYYDILVDTLVWVEPFSKSSKRRQIQHPKYYVFDVGVLNGCLDNFVAPADRLGVLFEHLVLQPITAEAKSGTLPFVFPGTKPKPMPKSTSSWKSARTCLPLR